jgi:hypothetical protein
MTNKLLLFISLISLLNFSCRKVKDRSTSEPYISNPTSYVLKRQIWTGPTTNGESFLYVYNSDHLVSKIERYQWGTFSANGGPPQTWQDTAYYTFEYTNGLCTKWSIDEGGAKGYYVYEYNEKKLPVKRTLYYSDHTVQSYSFYKYDNADNVIEMTDSTNKVDFRYVFTYNSSNNLTSVTDNILWSNPQQKIKYEWPTFDNKVNFIKAVNGLPSTFVWDNNYHSYSSASPNNVLAENYYVPVNMDQPFGLPIYYNYTYEYNNEGLPTTMKYGSWIVTFEYEKYK